MMFKHKLSRRLAMLRGALVLGALAAMGCTADEHLSAPADPIEEPLAATAAAAAPQFGHVFVVVEENTNYSSVIGSSAMPYLNSLANQYGLATQYYANTHPSIGNYFMLATGQIITNNDSYSSVVTADNLVRRILASGKTWKSYAEDLPSVGYTGGDVGNYARKHNIFALLSDVVNDATQRNNLVPFTQFGADLANGRLPHFSNIVPNLCNDAHDCSLSTADTWLKNNLTPLIASPTFQQDGLLIIVFDEAANDNAHGGGRIAWIVVSPQAKTGYQSSTLYQHESTLRLVLQGLGIASFPGAAAAAPDMWEFFQGTVPPPPPVCTASGNSWTNASFGSQSGVFTVEFDATPSSAAIDGVLGIGPSPATDYSGLAAIVRFNTGGTIDARNGGSYAAAKAIPYAAATTYHFRLAMDVPHHSYSAYVTPAGGAEQTVGTGFAFRSEQSGASALGTWGARTSAGSMNVCDFQLAGTGSAAVASVAVTPATASLTVGATRQLTATPRDSTGAALTGRAITWASNNANVATVSQTGLVTAAAAGTATITASSEGKSGTATVTVTLVPVSSVAVTPATAGLAPGATQQLTATTRDSAGNTLTGRTVTWGSNNTGVATVTGSGLVSAVAAGTATITATSEGKSGTGTITVAPPNPTPVCVASGNAWVNSSMTGQSGVFTAQFDATPSAAPIDGVTGLGPSAAADYSGLAAIVRFNTSGRIDARNGADYAAVQSISYAAGQKFHVRLVVDVPGHSYSAYVTPAGGAELAVGTGYAFRSEQSGATSLANWGARTSTGSMALCDLSVSAASAPPGAAPVAAITVTPPSANLMVGGTQQITATPRDSTGTALTGRSLTWASDNAGVAAVSQGGMVTAKGTGTATITATSEGKSGASALTVTPVPVASVTVSPATASLLVGATQQLGVTLKDTQGTPLTGRTVSWSSSNTSVATVTGAGLVTARAAGSATLTASSEGQSGTAAVTVTNPAPPPPPPPAGACAPTGSGVCRYVDPAGNDANPGTSSQPYLTLQKAAGVVNPGDVVVVRDGVYTGGSIVLNLSRSGTAGNWIVFKAEHQWGAVIDGQNNSSATGVELSGNYLRVEGFEVRGTNHYGIEAYGGSNVEVARNHVHDVGHYCTSTSNGIVGINAYVPNMVIEQNVVHDIGRYANGENGCSTSNTYWQNHDHGVYQGEGDNLVIRNNVFYNFARGWAIQRYSGSGHVVNGLTIVNNTFVGANPNKEGQIIIATATTNLVITNNIFYQPNTAGVWFDTGGLSGTVANNLTYGAGLTIGSTTGLVLLGNLSGDPKFVNLGGRDFHLQAGSAAVDRGLPLSLVLDDISGILRPLGLGYDIGACESR